MPTRAMTALSAVILAAISAGNACAEQAGSAPLPPPSMPAGSVAVERTPLGAPGFASPAPAAVAIASLNDHLDAVQELLTDQEDVRPGMVEQGENLQWRQIDEAITDGDFADVNSAEKQISVSHLIGFIVFPIWRGGPREGRRRSMWFIGTVRPTKWASAKWKPVGPGRFGPNPSGFVSSGPPARTSTKPSSLFQIFAGTMEPIKRDTL
jgi:hypothetical protein